MADSIKVILADYEPGRRVRDFVTVNPQSVGRVVVGPSKKGDQDWIYIGTQMPCTVEVGFPTAAVAEEILIDDRRLTRIIYKGLRELPRENPNICVGLDTYSLPVELPPPETLPLTA